MLRRAAALCILSLLSSWGASAHAQDDVEPRRPLVLQPLPQDAADAPLAKARAHAEQRPFVYALDPTTPSRGDATLEYGLGLAPGVAADRPLPASLAAQGVVHSFTVGYGVTDRIAPFVTGRVLSPGDGQDTRGGGAAGLRVQLVDPGGPFRLTIAGAALREAFGSWGAYARLAASYDVDRLRLVGNLHAERIFASGRDGVDLLAVAGASYRTLDVMRVGVEYVGQDLEDAFEHDVEGGAKHYAGPTVALDVDSGRVQIAAGPAFGLNEQSSRVMGRAAVLVAF